MTMRCHIGFFVFEWIVVVGRQSRWLFSFCSLLLFFLFSSYPWCLLHFYLNNDTKSIKVVKTGENYEITRNDQTTLFAINQEREIYNSYICLHEPKSNHTCSEGISWYRRGFLMWESLVQKKNLSCWNTERIGKFGILIRYQQHISVPPLHEVRSYLWWIFTIFPFLHTFLISFVGAFFITRWNVPLQKNLMYILDFFFALNFFCRMLLAISHLVSCSLHKSCGRTVAFFINISCYTQLHLRHGTEGLHSFGNQLNFIQNVELTVK